MRRGMESYAEENGAHSSSNQFARQSGSYFNLMCQPTDQSNMQCKINVRAVCSLILCNGEFKGKENANDEGCRLPDPLQW